MKAPSFLPFCGAAFALPLLRRLSHAPSGQDWTSGRGREVKRARLEVGTASRRAWLARAAASLALGAVAAGCRGPEAVAPPARPVTVTFDADTPGKPPADFALALTGGGGPISWVVREDSTAPGARRVLAQESADDTSYRFPLCVYEKFAARDLAVETTFKAIAGKVDQAAGVVFRYRPENYYIARANSLEDNIDLFKTVNGKRSKIIEVDQKVAAGVWHTLRCEARGPKIKVIFDGKTVIEAEDSTLTRAGQAGLWTKADSVSAFSCLKIEPLD